MLLLGSILFILVSCLERDEAALALLAPPAEGYG